MKPTITFAILHQSISFFICLPAVLCIILVLLRKIIFVNKVISCIIWRININHLYFSQICFPQDF